jgi:hypothetical protein
MYELLVPEKIENEPVFSHHKKKKKKMQAGQEIGKLQHQTVGTQTCHM